MSVALWAAHHFHLGTAATAVTAVLALTPMYQSWASYRADREDAVSLTALEQQAEALAQAVRRQWEEEASLRRLNDPYSVPVSWQAAPADLAESWSQLQAVATGWPGGPPTPPTEWAADERALAGTDGQIGDVVSSLVPTRRLVILGEPGSGKTMLLVRLVLDLLVRRERNGGDGVIPVLFPLASWNPAQEGLFAWMAHRLVLDYPILAEPSSTQHGRISNARALLDRRLILPILDGFDELPPALHAKALDAINRALPLGQGLVLSSRTVEYRVATTPAAGLSMKLAGAAGIELLPIGPADAAAYLLRDSGGGPAAERRWRPVISRLGTSTPVALTLRTPLMLFLASTVYNPRPGEGYTVIPDPAELCDANLMATPAAVEAHLFDAFVPAAYRPHPSYPSRWTAEQAERALVHLARHLQRNLGGTPDLAWWQLHRPASRAMSRVMGCVITGLVAGLIAGSLAFGTEWSLCLLAGSTTGILVMLTIGLSRPEPADAMRWSWNWPRFVVGAALGTFLGLNVVPLLVGLTGGDSDSGAPSPGSGVIGAGGGLAVGLLSALAASGNSAKADTATAVGPAALLALDRRAYRNLAILGTAVGTIVWVPIFCILGWMANPVASFYGTVAGVLFALAFGLMFASARTAWGAFTVTRWTLALRGRLPRDLMGFLSDAHERRGVLRQVGVAYQFRHIDLQHRLADRP
ncbi:NACHT domain-containing protein [Streptomyces noursei]|uniref:NACHT domain-containing protein n=1 Tax=Streptomyces noursei TaxID=1971 RepID=UPI003796A52A